MKYVSIILLILLYLLPACNHTPQSTLKIAATSIPHAEILESIREDLQSQGITLEILTIDDFNTPNRALADKEVDANFFQHAPFLETQIKDFHYPFIPLIAVHIEPMAIYSKLHHNLNEIKEGAKITIPSDISNQARALLLLEKEGLIELKSHHAKVSLSDIANNPLNLTLIEIDSPLLSRSLDDVDAAIISTNFALLSGLSPKKDSLAIEGNQSLYANIVVIRKEDSEKPNIQALKKALAQPKVAHFIEENYSGSIIPVAP